MSPDIPDSWRQILQVERAFLRAVTELQRTEPDAITVLGTALRNPDDRRTALRVLAELPESATVQLLNTIVNFAATSHRDALLAREVIGRVRRKDLETPLADIVRTRLQDADDDAYRRLAELLDHLGFEAQLSDLVRRARLSADPNIREVGDDYTSDLTP